HQIIHRDVKPANIMITKDNVVKIMDFGIAKSAASMTTTGQVLGTPTYMSPEQVRGKLLDGRSDIFSFGVSLYEMVVGEKPFTGQTITTIIYKIIHEPAIPPRELDVTVHPGISAIIMKALAKNPHERYQTGADLMRDLLNYKGFGSEAESTKIIAAVSKPAAASAAPPKVEAKRAAPPVQQAAAAAKASHSTAQALAAGKDSTVGVGIRIGNKPLPAVPIPPAAKNMKMAMAAGGVLLLLLVGLGVAKMTGGRQSVDAVQSPAPVAASPAQNDVTPPPAKTDTEVTTTEKPSPSSPNKTAAKTPAKLPQKPVEKAKTIAAVVPPAAAIATDKGNLQITSEPAGAKASLSGPTSGSGTTPVTLANLEPGNYTITVSKSGFASQSRNVRVIAGRTANVGADLKAAAPTRISVNSTPSGAEIILDGQPTGKVTPAQLVTSPGEHKIELRKGGYEESNITANVKEGETFTYAPPLAVAKAQSSGSPFKALRGLFGGNRIPEGKGMVNIKTTPDGADIFHKGIKIPSRTPVRFPMDPGTYQITVSKDGYKPAHKNFTVEKGKHQDVIIALEKK
ncbi:MAG TPA: serine/threonine-protein kinase, partial [Terriglobales bacterium]|nr:serine/threonine-protein kinase [Terriglobales bacterium]